MPNHTQSADSINMNNLTHHFLIASPHMPDERFDRTLIYICRHDKHGAMGLVINQPIRELSMIHMLDDLDVPVNYGNTNIGDKMVLAGGPIHPEAGFILHTGQPRWISSVALSENLCLTTSKDVLHNIAIGGVCHFQMCLGHSVWQREQLAQEIAQGDWLVCPADTQLLFETDYDKKWLLAGQKLGINLNYLSADIGYA